MRESSLESVSSLSAAPMALLNCFSPEMSSPRAHMKVFGFQGLGFRV